MVDDSRDRIKVYLDNYWTPANTLKDDGVSQLGTEIMYAWPDYSLILEFKAPSVVDVIVAVDQATSKANLDFDGYPFSYRESVPMKIRSVNKSGVTAALAIWQAEAEIRRILEAYPIASPTGSVRSLERTVPARLLLGQEPMWGADYILNYTRDMT